MATKLNPDQAEQIAHGLLDCADAIHRRLITDWKELDDVAQQSLVALAQQLCAQSSLLVNAAVGMILNNTKDAIGQIVSATKAGETAIENIQTVNKVISIATSLVKLGTAVASKDPQASIGAAGEVFDEIAS
jgi:hypothetical protein